MKNPREMGSAGMREDNFFCASHAAVFELLWIA